MKKVFLLIVGFLVLIILNGCGVWKFYKSRGINTKIIDSKTGEPIKDVNILYIASDIHDTSFKKGIIEERKTDDKGTIVIPSIKKWQFFMIIPPIIPTTYHTIVIWKDGYYPFFYSGSNISLETFVGYPENIQNKIKQIPIDTKLSTSEINNPKNLLGGVIKLIPISQE